MQETGKTYRGKQLSLDGKRFENCVFDRCELDYGGGIPPVLSGCSFENCSFSFSGKAAYTLAFLSGMHGGGFGAMVEQTFQGIRDGAYLQLPLQNLAPQAASRPPVDAHPLAFRTPRIVSIPKRKS
ncbi:MAG TPA: hypothetical protein VGX71_27020 [Pseudaminobacter sp.]|nr:hypothetical protein [Pseudaminobacter sp.]